MCFRETPFTALQQGDINDLLRVSFPVQINRVIIKEVHGGGGLELVKPAREPASSRPKPCASLKKPHESCPFATPCGPRRKKNYRGQRSAFPSETSRLALSILAHRGSPLPWLVNDRAALRLRRIWYAPRERIFVTALLHTRSLRFQKLAMSRKALPLQMLKLNDNTGRDRYVGRSPR